MLATKPKRIRNWWITDRKKTTFRFCHQWSAAEFFRADAKAAKDPGYWVYSSKKTAPDGNCWNIRLVPRPKDQTCQDYVSLYLICKNDSRAKPITADFTLELSVDGKRIQQVCYHKKPFPAPNGDAGVGTVNFIERRDIIDHMMSENLSGNITVCCTIDVWKTATAVVAPQLETRERENYPSTPLGAYKGKGKWITTTIWEIRNYGLCNGNSIIRSKPFSADGGIVWVMALQVTGDSVILTFVPDVKGIGSRTFHGSFNVTLLEKYNSIDLGKTKSFSLSWQLNDFSTKALTKKIKVKKHSLRHDTFLIYCKLRSCEEVYERTASKRASGFLNDPDGDCIIKTESREFVVTKSHLANSSRYFKRALSSSNGCKRIFCDNKQVIEEQMVSKAALEAILQFIYKGESYMIRSNPHELLRASDFLQIDELTQICEKRIIRKLSKQTILESVQLCEELPHLSLLWNCVVNWIADHYWDIEDSEFSGFVDIDLAIDVARAANKLSLEDLLF